MDASTPDRPLLELLLEIHELLERAGVPSTLIGAFALRLHVREATPATATEAEVRPDDPSTLARAVMATGDIDLVVSDVKTAERTLLEAGFIKDTKALVTYKRGSFIVDLIPGRPTPGPEGSIDIPQEACVASPLALPGGLGQVRVARPGALLALKAVAWQDRSEGRDLADIAAIALGGRYLGWELEEDLSQAVEAMPKAAGALVEVAERFSDPIQRGPIEFAKVVRSLVVAVERASWDEREEMVREFASEAVRLLLREYAQ